MTLTRLYSVLGGHGGFRHFGVACCCSVIKKNSWPDACGRRACVPGLQGRPARALRAIGVVSGAKSERVRPCGAMESIAFRDKPKFYFIIPESWWGLSNATIKFVFIPEGDRFHGPGRPPPSESRSIWPWKWRFSCVVRAVRGTIVKLSIWA